MLDLRSILIWEKEFAFLGCECVSAYFIRGPTSERGVISLPGEIRKLEGCVSEMEIPKIINIEVLICFVK